MLVNTNRSHPSTPCGRFTQNVRASTGGDPGIFAQTCDAGVGPAANEMTAGPTARDRHDLGAKAHRSRGCERPRMVAGSCRPTQQEVTTSRVGREQERRPSTASPPSWPRLGGMPTPRDRSEREGWGNVSPPLDQNLSRATLKARLQFRPNGPVLEPGWPGKPRGHGRHFPLDLHPRFGSGPLAPIKRGVMWDVRPDVPRQENPPLLFKENGC